MYVWSIQDGQKRLYEWVRGTEFRLMGTIRLIYDMGVIVDAECDTWFISSEEIENYAALLDAYLDNVYSLKEGY